MTANFVDQFGFNDEEFSEHDENIKWVLKTYSTMYKCFSDPVISISYIRTMHWFTVLICFCGKDCQYDFWETSFNLAVLRSIELLKLTSILMQMIIV